MLNIVVVVRLQVVVHLPVEVLVLLGSTRVFVGVISHVATLLIATFEALLA